MLYVKNYKNQLTIACFLISGHFLQLLLYLLSHLDNSSDSSPAPSLKTRH